MKILKVLKKEDGVDNTLFFLYNFFKVNNMLRVNNISKSFGNIKAVEDLSFEVKDGEIFGLLGVNGAGKTTTFRMIVGLLDCDSGKVLLDNKEIDYNITDSIGFLTEERSLFVKMTVLEQILFYGNLKGMDDKTIESRLDYWLKKLNIEEYKYEKIKTLSKGNQQKIQFIASVINEPKLLILDEPFTGLDPFNVEILMTSLKEMAKKGTSVIFSSHRMEHVEMFCDRLLILVKGKSVLEGSLKDIKNNYLKKRIHIKGNVDIKRIKEVEGVEKVYKTSEEIIVNVSSINIVDKVFNVVKKGDNIIKFMVEDPTLNEIYVSKVGDYFEE